MDEQFTLTGKVRRWFMQNDPDRVHLVSLLIRFEGCRQDPYEDTAGNLTVGVGHRMGEAAKEYANREWTVDEICAALQHDLAGTRCSIRDRIYEGLSIKQRQALMALVFNVGPITNSVLEHALDDYIFNEASMRRVIAEWVTYDHASNVEVRGLLRRRLAECALWVDGA